MALEANALATLTLTLGCMLAGWACDRIGTRTVMLVGWGYSIPQFVRNGWLAVIGSLVLTALVWACVLMRTGAA